MGLFDRLFGKAPPPPAPGAIPHALPLGLRIGARLQFDRMLERVAGEALGAPLPEGYQGVPCYGHVDLGGGQALHRFYLDDDAYLQVSTSAGDVEAIKAFVYVDTVNPPDKAAFHRWVLEAEHLGAEAIQWGGHAWERVLDGAGDTGRIPAMAYDEVLYRGEPARRDGDLTHYAMLYRRALPGLDREEFLLVTAEDAGPTDFCVTYAIGRDLDASELDIT